MDSVLVVATIMAALCFIVEIFTHRKERILLIDKIKDLDVSKDNNFELGKMLGGERSSRKSWPLRIGFLITGIGLGCIIGYIIASQMGLYSELSNLRHVNDQLTIIYSSCTLLMGGLGLLIAYLIEKKGESQNK